MFVAPADVRAILGGCGADEVNEVHVRIERSLRGRRSDLDRARVHG